MAIPTIVARSTTSPLQTSRGVYAPYSAVAASQSDLSGVWISDDRHVLISFGQWPSLRH